LAHKMLGEINWEYILVLYRISNSEREDSGLIHQHFELLTGQSPRLVELLMRLWDVYNQRGGISMFQTEMLFREALNEALLCVVNRENNYESHTLFERISSY
ncbi:AraC family transcriptional regulator, partial [Bacillus albus]